MSLVERYLAWLDSEIKIYETYHDSKENRAWTAIAAYVPAVIYLGSAAAPHLDHCHRIMLAFLLGCVGISVLMFVHMQFEMKWKADCTTRGLRWVRGLLTANPEYLEQLDKGVPPVVCRKDWPKFIQKEVDEYQRTRRWSRDKVRCFLCFAPTLHWHCIDAGLRTEFPSYVVLVITTLIAIGSLWVRRFG